MNFKKHIVILLFLTILMCAISAVSASDDSEIISADLDDALNIEQTSIPETDDNSGELKATETTEIRANETDVNSNASQEVVKPSATLKASKATVGYKKSTKWTIKLTDSNNKAIAGKNILLKIYTGSKYKTATVKTDANGVAKYNTKSLKAGTHKIVASLDDASYNCNILTSSVKVVKQTKIKIYAHNSVMKEGSVLTIMVLNKKTKKFINGVKLKLLIYTGKKYKTITLKTKKLGGSKGVTGYATNKLSVGKHKVKIMPVNIKYDGSKTSKMLIKKSSKKYPKWETTI